MFRLFEIIKIYEQIQRASAVELVFSLTETIGKENRKRTYRPMQVHAFIPIVR